MATLSKCTEVLHDIIHIHQECLANCAKLMDESPVQSSLYKVALQLSKLDNDHIFELRCTADTAPGGPAEALHIQGEIYTRWQEMLSRSELTGCEKYLAAIRDCYELALQCGCHYSNQVNLILLRQYKRFTALRHHLPQTNLALVS